MVLPKACGAHGLAAEPARRRGLDADTALYPRLAAGAAFTAFDTVLYRWNSGDGTADPGEPTARAFAVIAPALDTVEVRDFGRSRPPLARSPGRVGALVRLPGPLPRGRAVAAVVR
ncbi:hypothetical protein B4N89_37140 [Embleya scabrispora]|uniref:Uncharacterized protein n=1 Tax=Embleya scabrispora TaxID=159449 RepID=A0A1T3NM68_9ACTN|nr:hypothetical protein B4N89_37140 [Embleya scabrispora]